MTGQEIAFLLSEYLEPEYIHPDQPMSEYTSFRAGGDALCVAEVRTIGELRRVLTFVRKKSLSYVILGFGTNTIVEDEGYDGVVIKLIGDFSSIDIRGNEVICGAGASLPKAARMSAEMWLAGLEFASGIPGTVGGAIRQNAGAFGSQMSDVVKRVKVLNSAGEELVLHPHEMDFDYRHSIFCYKKYIILEAVMELKKGDKNVINEKIEKYTQERKNKQPLNYPNAGCIFKNPKEGFAAKFIQDAGLAGEWLGGAMVSDKHCGFIVNADDATATDIIDLMDKVRRTVYRDYSVRLEPEITIIGPGSGH